jgi:hypothetical protein
MHTGMPLDPIRYSVVGNNQLETSFDYIRLFLVVLLRLKLRRENAPGELYDVVANFADTFDKEPLWQA